MVFVRKIIKNGKKERVVTMQCLTLWSCLAVRQRQKKVSACKDPVTASVSNHPHSLCHVTLPLILFASSSSSIQQHAHANARVTHNTTLLHHHALSYSHGNTAFFLFQQYWYIISHYTPHYPIFFTSLHSFIAQALVVPCWPCFPTLSLYLSIYLFQIFLFSLLKKNLSIYLLCACNSFAFDLLLFTSC